MPPVLTYVPETHAERMMDGGVYDRRIREMFAIDATLTPLIVAARFNVPVACARIRLIKLGLG